MFGGNHASSLQLIDDEFDEAPVGKAETLGHGRVYAGK